MNDSQPLFASIRYIIASSLPSPRADELRHVLDTNGAVYLANGLRDPTLTTVITNSNRFEGWEVVSNSAERGRVVDIVTDQWVERSLILGKLQPPQYFSPDPSMIFSGVVACACDLPSADLEVLSAGITALGGQWRTGLTKDVTHLFALSPENAKYATAMHFKEETGVKVVLPHWFDDAVRLGMRGLKTEPYEWPDPEILKGVDGRSNNNVVKGKGKTAAVEQDEVKRNMYATAAIFTSAVGEGQSSPPSTLDISAVLNNKASVPETSSGARQVWNGRKILLSRSLELYKNRHEAVQRGIERAGGVVLRFEGDEEESEELTDEEKKDGKELSVREKVRRRNEAAKVEDCDIFVTRWRHGRAYVLACKSRKVIGTLPWLFHVQSTGILSNPQDQLLHYPIPKHPIENFANHVITVTNYTGDAREYLKKLICTMGAKFTPSMSGQNTVLIAAFIGGTKSTKAHSWSIPVVNHTWLEDCFIQWRNLTVGLEKYIVFPTGVDFSTLLGERGVGVGGEKGGRIEDEVEELEVMVFEEDEMMGIEKGEGNMDVDGPTRTDDSVKEAVRSLVEDEEQDRLATPKSVSKKPSKPQPSKRSEEKEKARSNAPDGMDVDYEPDEGDSPTTSARISEDEEIGGEKMGKRMKEKENHKSKIKAAKGRRLEDGKTSSSKVKTSGVKPKVFEEDEEEDEVTRSNNSKAEKKREGEVLELNDSESDDKAAKLAKGRSKQSKKRIEDDAEDIISTPKKTKKSVRSEIHMSPPSTRVGPSKFTPKAKVVTSSTTTKMMDQKKRATTPGEDEEEQEEHEPPRERKKKLPMRTNGAATLSSPSLKLSRRPRPPAFSKELESEDEEVEPVSKAKVKGGNRRQVTVELTKGAAGPDRPGKREVVRDDDEDEEENGRDQDVEGKVLKNTTEVMSAPSKKAGVDVSEANPKPKALLNRTKGDARTRIKRKSLKEEPLIVESEDEEVEVGMPVKAGKGVKKGRVSTAGEEDHVLLSSSKSRVAAETTSSKGKAKRKVISQQRSKPLHVYSSNGVDGEDDESTTVADGKPEVEEEVDGFPVAVSRGKAKGNVGDHVRKAQSTSTPKKTVSVLMPSLTTTGGPKKGGKKANGDGVEEREASKRPVAKSKSKFQTPTVGSDTDEAEDVGQRTRAAHTKLNSAKKITGKSKSKFERPIDDIDTDDGDDVEEDFSPRTRAALAKSNSIKNIAGQSSIKAMIIRSDEPDSRKRVAKVNKASNSVPREYMEIDEDFDRDRSTPGSTLSASLPRRNAAARASQRLHETIMPDLVNFESQMKKSKGKGRRSGGGNNLNAFALEFEKDQERDVGKRKKVEREEEEEEESDEEKKRKKKRRVSDENEEKVKAKGKHKASEDDDVDMNFDDNKPSSGVVLLTTQVTLGDDVIKSLTKLGVRMTTRPTECTHLLAPNLVRTEKFLCALACAPYILNSNWATASAAAKKLLPEKDFMLKDEVGEKKYNFKLAQALRRAESNNGKLLKGKTFYVTPKVAIDKKLLKNVVNACGGRVATQTPSARIISSDPDTRYVISCKEDISIWRPIAAQGFKIYNQELLLTGVMKQEIEWDREDFVVES